MSRTGQDKKRSAQRLTSGQSIVEGTAVMVVATFLVVSLMVCLLNIARISSYNYRLQVIASQGARQILANAYWLQMTYPHFEMHGGPSDPSSTSVDIGENCAYLINQELEMAGLPDASNFRINSEQRQVDGANVTFVSVDFDIRGLPIEMGGAARNPLVTLHAHGTASSAKYNVNPHGICLLHCVDDSVKPPIERAIRVPVYNATIGHDQPADGTWLRAGETVGTTAHAEVTIYCKHDGAITLPNGVSKPWGPWPNELFPAK